MMRLRQFVIPAKAGIQAVNPLLKIMFKNWIPAFAGMTSMMLLTASLGSAATNSKAGTSGAQFLKIGAGARSTAMGEAFVAVADDVNAVYYNPAGLAGLERPEMTAMHTQWVQGMNYDFGAFALPSEFGTFGISVATLKADDLEKRTADESFEGNFESIDSAYGLSFAKEIRNLWSVGLTARYLQQKIDTASAETWTGDVGITKDFEEKPYRLGVAVRHFGQGVKYNSESDPLPLTFDAGASTRFFENKFMLALNIKKARDNDIQFGSGGEYRQVIRNDFRFAVRGGYNTSHTDADGSGLSLGGGLGYRQFDLDVAWVPLGDLGNAFRTAAVVKF